ncbi:efflux RND transporter periplasmic adaptor subunit [Cognatiyoonia sp. IB215182]|uniref:efflux RND transporter periplasmic adaptor subunit n=1 Tax=Cognatiyoonia sp. IB215182 TaxID=3097353 RepID=UPI002A0AC875|nr:efflux RND transporter periplasmic adaptor subunit [Cognatiyoonia sp. IB215182]MDX8354975.1 efflux RND transporter periplasmic adaptor subunit [Cognatiyoonia sp. IB215182]
MLQPHNLVAETGYEDGSMSDTPQDVEEKLGIGKQRGAVPRWAKYLIGGAVFVGAAMFWMSSADDARDMQFVTAPATIGDLRVIVTATGTVEPTNMVEISSELSGTLVTVNVDFNDTVTEGTVLAELDTTKLEAQLAVSRASLDSAIARVAMAQATWAETRERYETTRSLEERGVTPYQTIIADRAAYVRAQSALQSAMADRALAEADLDLHYAELEKTCICSPIDGIVLDRAVDAGQIVAATLSAPILFTVAEDLTKMELQVDIDEADIGRTVVGNPAIFTVDAYDELTFPAEISEIRFAPLTVDGVVTYKAILSVDNSEMLLRPGMTATADITVAEITEALIVPNAALRYAPPAAPVEQEDRSGLLGMLIPDGGDNRNRGDDRTLWVMRGDTPVEISIRAGDTDGRMTQILEGELSAGDLVIVDQIDG